MKIVNKILFALMLMVGLVGCTTNSEQTFEDVNKISIEAINQDGSRELRVEMSDIAEMQKIIDFVELDKNGTSGCAYQLVVTF